MALPRLPPLGSFSVVCSFIGYQTRGAAPSNFDINYAYNLGFAATRLILDGFSGYMATIGSLREKVEFWQPVGVPGFPNSYNLSGAGIGLNIFKDNDFSVRSSLAWKVGSNPGRDILGRDSDSEARSVRFWVQLTKQF